MIAFAVELFMDARQEIVQLVPQHWDEVGSLGDRFDRAIDYDAYQWHEANGRLLVVVAREDGKMFGYVIGALGTDLHRVTREPQPRRVASFSVLVNYIVPERRGYARAMTKAVERAVLARTQRPTTISYRTKRSNNAGRFFEAMGYEEMETTRTKVVEP